MADASPYLSPWLTACRPVPAAGPGVCPVCRSGLPAGHRLCHSCALTISQVSKPLRHVVPVSLYQVPGPLWRLLRCYKDGPQPARGLLTVQLAALLGAFTARHLPCLAGLLGGEPTVVTTVPSTRPGRRDAHPLRTAVTAVTSLADRHQPLLAPGPALTGQAGPARDPALAEHPVLTGHNQADDATFVVTRPLAGQRVLLIDDTFTTGARVQSAASALRRAGAAGVAGLTIGRVIWPGRNDNCRRIWAESCAQPFSLSHCCLCRPGAAAGRSGQAVAGELT